MLNKKISYLLITLLIGFMIGCGSSNPLADKAQSSIKGQNFQAALESAQQSVQQYPADPLGYYYEGVAYSELANAQENPSQRTDYYKKMETAFDSAQTVASRAEKVPDEIKRISSIKQVSWRTEHNRAVKLATDDSLKNTVQNPMQKSLAHIKNATMIAPDSTMSWNVLTQVAAINKDYKLAAEGKEKYLELTPDSTIKAKDYVQLGSYYYQMKNEPKVLETFEKAQKRFPDDEDVVSNLADSYSRAGQPDKAITTVEKLVNQNPENAKYHLSLGTQIYQKALSLQEDSADASEAEIQDLITRAEKQMKKTIALKSDSPQAYNILGIINQNRASDIYQKRNKTNDNAEAKQLDEKGDSVLKESMKNYEKATELDPDKKEYWRSLFNIYTTLGMDQKAQDAQKKAGM